MTCHETNLLLASPCHSAGTLLPPEPNQAGVIQNTLTREAAEKFQTRYADAEAVVERVTSLMDRAVSEWRTIKVDTKEERDRLQQVSNALQDRFAWQELLWDAVRYLTAIGLGLFLGHYYWRG